MSNDDVYPGEMDTPHEFDFDDQAAEALLSESGRGTDPQLADLFVAYPTWSRDSRYIYFDGILDNQENYYRVDVSAGKLEPVFSLKGFQAAGSAFGSWSGIAPDAQQDLDYAVVLTTYMSTVWKAGTHERPCQPGGACRNTCRNKRPPASARTGGGSDQERGGGRSAGP